MGKVELGLHSPEYRLAGNGALSIPSPLHLDPVSVSAPDLRRQDHYTLLL